MIKIQTDSFLKMSLTNPSFPIGRYHASLPQDGLDWLLVTGPCGVPQECQGPYDGQHVACIQRIGLSGYGFHTFLRAAVTVLSCGRRSLVVCIYDEHSIIYATDELGGGRALLEVNLDVESSHLPTQRIDQASSHK